MSTRRGRTHVQLYAKDTSHIRYADMLTCCSAVGAVGWFGADEVRGPNHGGSECDGCGAYVAWNFRACEYCKRVRA